ncbi:MAG TPA: hypothetical protein VMW83_16395 [Spirochaetia bacterium]|nr:hypothetical protein [Spirochaetia bacterium]
MADCYLTLNDHEKYLQYIYKSFDYDRPRPEFCCRLGYYYLQVNKFHQAIFWYKLATELKKPLICWGTINQAYWTWLPHLQLCLCYDKIGDYNLAYKHNEIAAAFIPDDYRILYNRNHLRNRSIEQGCPIHHTT